MNTSIPQPTTFPPAPAPAPEVFCGNLVSLVGQQASASLHCAFWTLSRRLFTNGQAQAVWIDTTATFPLEDFIRVAKTVRRAIKTSSSSNVCSVESVLNRVKMLICLDTTSISGAITEQFKTIGADINLNNGLKVIVIQDIGAPINASTAINYSQGQSALSRLMLQLRSLSSNATDVDFLIIGKGNKEPFTHYTDTTIETSFDNVQQQRIILRVVRSHSQITGNKYSIIT